MWVKKYFDTTVLIEDRSAGITWLKTPSQNIKEVYLYINGQQSESLSGYLEYWHSRSAILNPQAGRSKDTHERIQGRRPDGTWDTIEFSDNKFVKYNSPKAIGKPVLNG